MDYIIYHLQISHSHGKHGPVIDVKSTKHVECPPKLSEGHVHAVNPNMAHHCNIWEKIRCFRDDGTVSRVNKTKDLGTMVIDDGKETQRHNS